MSGRGSITRRGKGSWRIKYEKGRDPESGNRLIGYKTVRGKKSDAQQELTRILQSLDSGSYVDPTAKTVSEYLRDWLDNYARHAVSGNTFERYEGIVTKHLIPALGHIRLVDLKPLAIQAYYTEALQSGRRDGAGGLLPITVRHHHRVLFEALRQAVKWRLLAINPAETVDAPRADQKEIEILDAAELTVVLKTAKPTRSYPAILLAATTGMRRGEVLGLRWKDIDLDKAVLNVNHTLEETKAGLRLKEPKSRTSRRNIALPELTVRQLRQHRAQQSQERLQLGLGRDDKGYVFANLEGGPIRPRNLTKEFSRIVTRAGVRKVSLHSLRHSHASALLRDGVHVKVVSERLGHSNISITLQVYAHVMPSMQADAAALIDAAMGASLED